MKNKLTDAELLDLLNEYNEEARVVAQLSGVLGKLRQVTMTLETALADGRGPIIPRLRAIRDGLIQEAQGIVTAYRLSSHTSGALALKAGITPSGQILG